MSHPTEPPAPGPEHGREYHPVDGPGYGPAPGPEYGAYGAYGAPYTGPDAGVLLSPTNGNAVAALITGIAFLVLSWCCGLGIAGVIPIVLGVKARREIRATGGAQQGEGLAVAGIVTGILAVVLGVLVLGLLVLAMAAGVDFDAQTTYRLGGVGT